MSPLRFTAIITKDGDGYESHCPEFDIASQGNTVEEAAANLKEAVELFMECAPLEEVSRRFRAQFPPRFDR